MSRKWRQNRKENNFLIGHYQKFWAKVQGLWGNQLPWISSYTNNSQWLMPFIGSIEFSRRVASILVTAVIMLTIKQHRDCFCATKWTFDITVKPAWREVLFSTGGLNIAWLLASVFPYLLLVHYIPSVKKEFQVVEECSTAIQRWRARVKEMCSFALVAVVKLTNSIQQIP